MASRKTRRKGLVYSIIMLNVQMVCLVILVVNIYYYNGLKAFWVCFCSADRYDHSTAAPSEGAAGTNGYMLFIVNHSTSHSLFRLHHFIFHLYLDCFKL